MTQDEFHDMLRRVAHEIRHPDPQKTRERVQWEVDQNQALLRSSHDRP